MTEQTQAAPVATENADAKGVNPGVKAGDLADYQNTNVKDAGIPKAPVISDRNTAENDEHAALVAENMIPADTQAKAKEPAPEAEQAAAVPEQKTETPQDADYVSYGHPGADSAVEILKELEVPATEAAEWFKKAGETRNLEDIDVAAIEKRIGKAKATLVVSAVKDYLGSNNQTVDSVVTAVYDEFGGQDNFVKVRDFINAKAKADPAVAKRVDELNKMFDIGENAARLAAQELRKIFDEDPSASSLNVSITTGDSPDNKSHERISRADFIQKLKAAEDKGDKQEAARLRAMRLESKKHE